MIFRHRSKAFSLVELMMLLLISSLIVAALVPVVTKKHFRLPSLVNHGAYMCYYDNGVLKEAKWAGKMQQKVVFDRQTDNCVFVPPKKAAFFQISAIGGGGGGGDSGYTGGHWISEITEEKPMTPFGLTEEILKNNNIDPDEFRLYAGQLWGYARGAASGAGGKIGYAVQHVSQDCEEYGTEQYCEKYKDAPCKAEYDSATKTCSLYNCHSETVCGPSTWEERDCSWTEYFPCDSWSAPYQQGTGRYETVVKPGSCHIGPPVQDCMDCLGNYSGTTCPPGDQSMSVDGCGLTSVTRPGEEICEYETREIMETKRDCLHTPDPVRHACTTQIEHKSCTTYNDIQDADPYATETKESASECTVSSITSECDVYGSRQDTTVCASGWFNVYSYTLSHQYGNPGAAGAACVSPKVNGDLGLSGAGGTTYSGDGADGADRDAGTSVSAPFALAASADQGKAACYNGYASYFDVDCGSDASYGYYNITGTASASVKAGSATSGGGGGGRGTYFDPVSGITLDTPESPTITASAGSCLEGSIPSSGHTVCGSGNYGYCLQHHYGTIEPGGKYIFQYGYDNNYIGYGSAGQPGEFKTIIVRSLKDIDLTIKVGRGGSAAALNLGQRGQKGSPTSMGTIISAAGGAGGAGSQQVPGERLKPFNPEVWEKEDLCYFYDKYTSQDESGNWLYPTEHQKLVQKLTAEPNYCDELKNNSDKYIYHRLQGNELGALPTSIGITSSIMNFVFNKADRSEAIQKFTQFGRGGKGGSVEHTCWGGRAEVIFEGVVLNTSVFVDEGSATEYAKSRGLYVPANCRASYTNIPAGPGVDGALLIKW